MKNENLYTEGCIRTFSGIYFNVANPTIEMICIEDIAHALSMMPRFGGHMPVFYSVAEHCILGADKIEMQFAKAFLLHDAAEAYLIDMPSPIKDLLPEYRVMEDRIMQLIARKFDIAFPFSPEVKSMDREMLQWEWNNMVIKPAGYHRPLTQQEAKLSFIDWFEYLSQ